MSLPIWIAESVKYGVRMAPEHAIDSLLQFSKRNVDAAAADLIERVRERLGSLAAEPLLHHLTAAPPRAGLARIVLRILVLELNVQRVEGLLHGATPAERFDFFLARLSDTDFTRRIWRDYPLMHAECHRLLAHWVSARCAFAEHLAADFGLLRGLGIQADLREIDEISFDAGDSHEGGRSVAIVHFGRGQSVVYKPRAVSMEARFQALLDWVNAKGFEPRLRTVRVLDRGDHGWLEHVGGGECDTSAAVERFYRRQGGYLALLHALRARDLHMDNVIAAGEHPFLVDLECLFTGDLNASQADSAGDEALMRGLFDSTVLAVGMLPFSRPRTDAAGRETSGDVSGLNGGGDSRLSAGELPQWVDAGTDTMRLAYGRVPVPASANLPRLYGEVRRFDEYRDVFLSGFERMYRLIRTHADDLLAEGGLLETFRGARARHILGATQTYNAFLWASCHPHLLGAAEQREKYLDRALSRQKGLALGAEIAASERAQLAAGDIPIFTADADGTCLIGGDGRVIPGALAHDGLSAVRERIAGFGDDDLLRQRWIVECAAATAAAPDLDSSPVFRVPRDDRPVHRRSGSKEAPDAGTVVGHAIEIGDELIRSALRHEGEVGWLGLASVSGGGWQLLPTGLDLYSGNSGIGLFFAYLARVTGQDRFHELARDISYGIVRRMERAISFGHREGRQNAMLTLGMSGGLTGALYFLTHWAALTADTVPLTRLIDDVAPGMEEICGADETLDVVGGAAGHVLALCAAWSVAPSHGLVGLIGKVSTHLAERGVRTGDQISWPTAQFDGLALGGFAHGASGIALALARAARVTGDDTRLETARAALRFERSLRDEHGEAWPDLRPNVPWETMVAWCHGAPGAGLARLALAETLGDDRSLAADIELAARMTADYYQAAKEYYPVRNLSLCHGELGNLDFLWSVARKTGEGDLLRLAENVTTAVLAAQEDYGWICGVPRGLRTPGLLLGLAGIGLGYLRIADPARVPCLLTLDAPAGNL
ncbi:type 2 lanthipeptide synthetase LanM family protein [Microbispora rosea]|uniref:type 2 lanthipeptide synthetase LanM family protein n=1 Tax=Microbispora rosea TaxID=58117 RepID=UPI0037C96F1F